MRVDPAFDETERILKKTEKQIAEVYKEARDDLQAKLDDYLRRFEIKDKTWQGWVKSGYKTQKEYEQWRIGQMAIGRRWEQMRDNLAEDLHHANDIAKSVVKGHMPEVYAINHDYAAYEVESGTGIDTSYTLYDRQTVERLFKDDDIIPRISTGAAAKDLAWNNKQVQGAMLQGILQGETISELAYRIAAVTAESNHKSAIRSARTMFTGVQNVGRVDSYIRAQKMGIELEQSWMAMLDKRTRPAHRELDGVSVPVGEYFENSIGKIRYPGDPQADAANIANCRCCLRANLSGFEWNARNLSQRNTKNFHYDSYDEWREEKESTSNPIDLPEKLSEQERQYYINEYRFGGRKKK